MSIRVETTPQAQQVTHDTSPSGRPPLSQQGDTTVGHDGEDAPPPINLAPSNAGRMAAFGGTGALAGGALLAAASGPFGWVPLLAGAIGLGVGAASGLVAEQVTRHKVPFARTSGSLEQRGTNAKAAPRGSTGGGKGSKILSGIKLTGTSPGEYRHKNT